MGRGGRREGGGLLTQTLAAHLSHTCPLRSHNLRRTSILHTSQLRIGRHRKGRCPCRRRARDGGRISTEAQLCPAMPTHARHPSSPCPSSRRLSNVRGTRIHSQEAPFLNLNCTCQDLKLSGFFFFYFSAVL